MSETVSLYDSKGKVIKTMSKRNMAFSTLLREQMPTASFTKWSVKKAVKEGLRSSVWIFRAFNLIASSAAGIPLRVVDASDGEPLEKHELNQVLAYPNKQLSRKDCFGLIYNWLLLTGLAYFKIGDKSSSGSGRFPLWPVSPDRISPVRSRDIDLFIEGYCKAEDAGKGKVTIAFKPEEIIPFRIMDPANPLLGMSPLFAASRVIDTDIEQQKYNKSAMQNMGVLEGLITFDLPLTQQQLDAQAEAWGERYTGASKAKQTAFLGNKASYERLSLTPNEADFINTRKANRDEILSACGTPPQLVGAQEASTMDNFRTSEAIHWRNTIVPLVDVVVDGLNFFFTVNGMLKEGQVVAGDYSNVQALQQNFKEKTFAAEKLFKMGVPVENISSLLKLGLEAFEGWEKPYNGQAIGVNPATGNPNKDATQVEDKDDKANARVHIKPMEQRQKEFRAEDKKREDLAAKRAKGFAKLLTKERGIVESVLDESPYPLATLKIMLQEDDPFETADAWADQIGDTMREGAAQAAKGIIIEKRGYEEDLSKAIDDALLQEGVILKERSLILQTTAELVISQVGDGLDQGHSIQEIKKALVDVGGFSPERALRISRTVTGTASSMGQLEAGKLSGAERKKWSAAIVGSRQQHIDRDGETVGINDLFTRIASDNGEFPRYPLDPNIAPGDRINCRCSLTFE